MSAIARAAEAYREAVEVHREAKANLETILRDARAKEGLSVQELAKLSGYSRQRIYQLISTKEDER